MKKLLAILLFAPVLGLGQVQVQKAQGTNQLSNGPIVVGPGNSITATGGGQIIPTSVPGTLYVSNHQSTASAGTTTVTPTTQLHTEEITLSGSAGAISIVVVTTGIVPGARADLIFTIPATSGLVVTVYSGSLSGAVIQTFTTTGSAAIPAARLTCNFSNNQWNALYYQGPIP